jgi:hypothetical protein
LVTLTVRHGEVDRDEIDRLRKRFMKLDKVRLPASARPSER